MFSFINIQIIQQQVSKIVMKSAGNTIVITDLHQKSTPNQGRIFIDQLNFQPRKIQDSLSSSSMTLDFGMHGKRKQQINHKSITNIFMLPQNHAKIGHYFRQTVGNGPKTSRQQIEERADSSARQLSESNRMKSKDKIKTEQMCFRFKLKMISILRRMNFKNQEIQTLQSQQPEQFIISFSKKIINRTKASQNEQNQLKQKNLALCQAIKIKNEQITLLKSQIVQKQKHFNSSFPRISSQLKQCKSALMEKQKQESKLKLKIFQLNSFIQAIKRTEILQEEQKNRGFKQRVSQMQQIMTEKIAKIVEQWKNKMYSTVNEYQEIIEKYAITINKKDEEIRSLKMLVSNSLKIKA